MSEEEINIIKEQLYLENGNRASYIDITGEEAEEFIKAVEKLLKENEKLNVVIEYNLAICENNYVSKKKILSKIKELEELFDKNEKEITIQYQNQFIVDVVGILEQLLGDDEQ